MAARSALLLPRLADDGTGVFAGHPGQINANQQVVVEGKRYLASAVRPRTTIALRDLCVAAVTQQDPQGQEEYNVTLIPAGSKLPYEAKECFTPIQASTRAVRVKLYDGHAGELSKNYLPLQEAEVEVQPTDPANNDNRIEFTIHMDSEGLVHIEVRDKLRNWPVPIKLKFDTGLSDIALEEARASFWPGTARRASNRQDHKQKGAYHELVDRSSLDR